jgi:hypothetical protein
MTIDANDWWTTVDGDAAADTTHLSSVCGGPLDAVEISILDTIRRCLRSGEFRMIRNTHGGETFTGTPAECSAHITKYLADRRKRAIEIEQWAKDNPHLIED